MAFEPGKSGNPSGRAAESAMEKEVKRLAKEKCPRAIERLAEWMESDNAKASVSACNALMDRGIGKPKQPIVGGDEDDNPVQIVQKVERSIVRSNTQD